MKGGIINLSYRLHSRYNFSEMKRLYEGLLKIDSPPVLRA